LQALEIDGLGEIVGEAGLAGSGDVFFHSETGQSDGGDGDILRLTKLADQIVAGAVGKADIAEKEIERFFGGLDGAGDGVGEFDVVAEAQEQTAQDMRGVFVIFHQQNAQGPT
jgi:hypothetical protein